MNPLLAIFACVLVAEITITSGVKSSSSSRRIVCSPIPLLNGRVRYRPKSGFVQFVCNKSYILAGEKYMKCVNGKWEGDIPTCVRNTCKSISMPKNGFVYPSHRGGVLNFYCTVRYELHGPRVVYCDGKKWSSYLPSCIDSTRNVSLSCNFEHEDLCGWSHDINHDFDWTRLRNSTPSWHVGTGPSHDHTYGKSGEGYYMYIESTSKKLNDTARLISPVYKKQVNNTCLEFFYHMHGSTMGELRVYLKKVKESWDLPLSDAYFVVSGNQGLEWRRSLIQLGTIDDDFQIIMEGVRGSSYLSDIAIDDVRLIENCAEEIEESTSISSTTNDVTEEDFIYESCSTRCGIKHGNGSLCDCDDTCFSYGSCCADYISACLLNDFTVGEFTEENFTTESEGIETTEPEYTSPTMDADEETTLEDNPVTTIQPIRIFNKHKIYSTKESAPTSKKPAITTARNILTTASRKPTSPKIIKPTPTTARKPTTAAPAKPTTAAPTKPTTAVPRRPTTAAPTKPTTAAPRRPTTAAPTKPTTNTPKKPTTIIPKQPQLAPAEPPYILHKFNHSRRILYNTRTVVDNITKAPIRQPNYKKSYANNKSFRDKENDYFKDDMLTITTQTDDVEFVQISSEVPKKLASLLQVEHANTHDAKVGSSGIPTFIIVSVGLLCVGILVTVYLVKRRIACTRIGRIRNGSYGDSASDVRFLTGDEMLDFTLATPN